MSRRRHSASSSTTAAAMSLAQLERWLHDRAERRPVATSLPVLDGYIAAIVAGPVSISPLDWICPLLAIDADAFNHGGTPEFAAISAVVQRHNEISNVLSTAPHRFAPLHSRKPNGDVDAAPWCQGFHAAMQPRLKSWAPLLDTRNINHGLPSCCTVWTIRAIRCSDRLPRPRNFCATPTPISQRSSRPCASTGCRSATLVLAEYRIRGSSCRLRLSSIMLTRAVRDTFGLG
jgi:uncharacterized protein